MIVTIRDVFNCQGQGRVPPVFLDVILLIVDKVPALNEMRSEILDDWTSQAHRKVGPSHSCILRTIQFITHVFRDVFEVVDPSVVVVLTRKHSQVDIRRVNVDRGMRISVPTAKAQIEAAQESNLTIDETQLLMMSPVENNIIICTVECV